MSELAPIRRVIHTYSAVCFVLPCSKRRKHLLVRLGFKINEKKTNGCTPHEFNNIMGRVSYLAMVKGPDDPIVKRFRAIMSKVEVR